MNRCARNGRAVKVVKGDIESNSKLAKVKVKVKVKRKVKTTLGQGAGYGKA